MHVLDLIERIYRLDAIRVQLVEDKADPSTTRKLAAGEFLVTPLQYCTVFIAELCDDVEDDVTAVAEQRVAEG